MNQTELLSFFLRLHAVSCTIFTCVLSMMIPMDWVSLAFMRACRQEQTFWQGKNPRELGTAATLLLGLQAGLALLGAVGHIWASSPSAHGDAPALWESSWLPSQGARPCVAGVVLICP